jgi:hypothetical protein
MYWTQNYVASDNILETVSRHVHIITRDSQAIWRELLHFQEEFAAGYLEYCRTMQRTKVARTLKRAGWSFHHTTLWAMTDAAMDLVIACGFEPNQYSALAESDAEGCRQALAQKIYDMYQAKDSDDNEEGVLSKWSQSIGKINGDVLEARLVLELSETLKLIPANTHGDYCGNLLPDENGCLCCEGQTHGAPSAKDWIGFQGFQSKAPACPSCGSPTKTSKKEGNQRRWNCKNPDCGDYGKQIRASHLTDWNPPRSTRQGSAAPNQNGHGSANGAVPSDN